MKKYDYLALTVFVLGLCCSNSFSALIVRNQVLGNKCLANIFSEIKTAYNQKHKKPISLPGNINLNSLKSNLKIIVDVVNKSALQFNNNRKKTIVEGIQKIGDILIKYPYLLPKKLEKSIKDRMNISPSQYNKERSLKAGKFIKNFYKLLFKYTNKFKKRKTKKTKRKLSNAIKNEIKKKLDLNKYQLKKLDEHFLEIYHNQNMKKRIIKNPVIFTELQSLSESLDHNYPQARWRKRIPQERKETERNYPERKNSDEHCSKCKTNHQIWNLLKKKILKKIKRRAKNFLNKNMKKNLKNIVKKEVKHKNEKNQQSTDKLLIKDFLKKKLYKPGNLKKFENEIKGKVNKQKKHKLKKKNVEARKPKKSVQTYGPCQNSKKIAKVIIKFFTSKF